MSSKEWNPSLNTRQKFIKIQGHEYTLYPSSTIIDFQKASASQGAILESKELLSTYHPEVLKLSILSGSSQGVNELTATDFTAAEKKLYYFYQTLNKINNYANEHSELNDSIPLHGRIIRPDIVDGIQTGFIRAMEDNFNTALAVSEFQQVFKYTNSLLQNANENPLHKLTTLKKIYGTLVKAANLLGIFLEEPEEIIREIKEKYIKLNNIDMNEVKELIKERQEARFNKNYALSDELKAKLDQKGIIVQDTPHGSEWDIKELFV